jgi:thiamine kinase
MMNGPMLETPKQSLLQVMNTVELELAASYQWILQDHQGTTNQLWLGYIGSASDPQVVLRVSPKVVPLGVDHTREVALLEWLSHHVEAETAARPVEIIAKGDGWIVMPYLDSREGKPSLDQGLAILTLLKKLKEIDAQTLGFVLDYEALWHGYEKMVRSNIERQLLTQVKSSFASLPKLKNRCVHHDLHPGNCLYQGGSLVLIDWEYAGWGAPWADLYALYTYWKLPISQLFETYELSDEIGFAAFEAGMQSAAQWIQSLDKLWALIAKKEA